MKKILLVMAILLIATPTWAGLTITATSPDCNTVQIYYDMDVSDPNLPRAFALEISLDNDANIGPVTYVDPNFHVYPGSIVITGGVVTDQGTPVAESDVNSMIVEMGSLYAADDPCHTSPPAENSTLLIFKVQNDKDCNVSLAQNAIRGGVVMEDTTQEFSPSYVTLTGSHVEGCGGCFPSSHPDYAEWLTVGEPDSWCYPRQCHGDATGEKEQMGKPYYWVSDVDLGVLIEGYGKTYTDPETNPWIAADFTHAAEQMGKPYYRVSNIDLNILIQYYGKPDEEVDPNCLDVP
jgi:hypothetical protein